MKTQKAKANRSGLLKVSSTHKIYWEEWGNPKGVPIVYIHGGPGGSFDDSSTRFFDLDKYRVVLFDQRGCGRSIPKCCIEENTTLDLVEDMEKLRKHLKIKSWVLFGGSWGSTLALFYAISHRDKVDAMILRGVFLGSESEWEWFWDLDGAAKMFPSEYISFMRIVPMDEMPEILKWYYKQLCNGTQEEKKFAARHWCDWERHLISYKNKIKFDPKPEEDYQMALMECHYAINNSFEPSEKYIINNLDKIRMVPTWIIHGQMDFVCAPFNAHRLHWGLPKSRLIIVKGAGHSASEPKIFKELKKATEFFAEYLTWLKLS